MNYLQILPGPYCMSKKSWPNLYINLLYEIGQVFLDSNKIVLLLSKVIYEKHKFEDMYLLVVLFVDF